MTLSLEFVAQHHCIDKLQYVAGFEGIMQPISCQHLQGWTSTVAAPHLSCQGIEWLSVERIMTGSVRPVLCSVSCCGVVVSMPVLQAGDPRFESW